jgi:SAM-dependent methyltransferase
MGAAAPLVASTEALAALAAYLRVESEGIAVEPQVHELLRAISTAVAGEDPGGIGPGGMPIVGMARAFLAQSAALVADPGRASGWTTDDETLLQGIGRTSAAIGPLMAGISETLPGMAAALGAPGGAFLDVGTGCGWLAISLARSFPSARVVGIDIWDRVLSLAQQNVAGSGLADRVEIRRQDVTQLDEDAVYDAVWLPLPFLPKAIVPAAIAASVRALRPGGWLLPGTFGAPPGQLQQLLIDLRVVRSGGHPWRAADFLPELTAAGLAEVHEVPRTWTTPLVLFAGRRPA